MKGVLAVLLWAMSIGPAPAQQGAIPDPPAGDPVVDLIRQAMRNPDGEEVWSRLQQSLAAVSGSGAVGIPEPGTRGLPESAARGEVTSELRPSRPANGSLWRDVKAVVEGVESGQGVWMMGVALMLGSLLLLRRGGERTQGLRRPAGAVVEKGDPSSGGDGGSPSRSRLSPRPARQEGVEPLKMESAPGSGPPPWSFAVALCRSGLPTHEVARRTGLAQDALKVLLALQETSWPRRRVPEGGR